VTERKRHRGSIAGTPKRRSSALSIPTSSEFSLWDFDGRILEANDEFLGMVGYDREEPARGQYMVDRSDAARLARQEITQGSNSKKTSGRFEIVRKGIHQKGR